MKYPHPDEFCLDFLIRNPAFLGRGRDAFITAIVFSSSQDWRKYYYPLYQRIHRRSLKVDSRIFSKVCSSVDTLTLFHFLISRAGKFVAPSVYIRMFGKALPAFRNRKRHLLALTGSLLGFSRRNPQATRRLKAQITYLMNQRHPDIPHVALPSAVVAGCHDQRTVEILRRAIRHRKEDYRLLAAEALDAASLLKPTVRRKFASLLTERDRVFVRTMCLKHARYGRSKEHLKARYDTLFGEN